MSTAPSITTSLPIHRTRLIGRVVELATARSLLLDESVPLLTLSGPAGVGKTRLALALAGEVTAAYADGVIWVDLSPVTDASLILATIATAAGHTPGSNQPDVEEFARSVRSRQALLLLDNCEHLLTPIAFIVATLLRECPALQVLATSRAPLHIRGEHEFSVEPLALPPSIVPVDSALLAANDAVRLFLDRARAIRPSLPIDNETVASVAAICRAFDGLPLAIELAATRVRILSPSALLAQVPGRLQLLRGGAKDLPPRQRTMHSAIAWSYDLLDSEERRFFRFLGIFIGGFDLEAAAAITARDYPTTMALLEALVSQNLVRRQERAVEGGNDRPPRFGMLETLREFSLDQLAANEELDEATALHALYFGDLVALALPLWDEPILALVTRFDQDYANVRMALTWLAANDPIRHVRVAGVFGPYWYALGQLAEGRHWLDRALAVADQLGDSLLPGDHAMVLISSGLIRQMQGEPANAQPLLERAITQADEAADPWKAAIARTFLGGTLISGGEYDRAAPLFKAALAQWRALAREAGIPEWRVRGRQEWVGIALFHLGLVAFAQHDWDRADRLLTEAVPLYEAGGDEVAASDPLHYLFLIACERADFEPAITIVTDILRRLRTRGSDPALANGIADVATLAAARGDPESSARLFGAAARLLETGSGAYSLPARDAYDRALASARSALGEEAWTAAYSDGQTMLPRQSFAEAEAWLGSNMSGLSTTPRRAGAVAGDGTLPSSTESAPNGAWPMPGFDLTQRELEVLNLLCQRLTDQEIADRLFVSPRTASSHVSSLLGKLQAANRREAAAIAVRNRLV
jgi:predicted ATPase/DNA-binding CsgD family transcriptional regulator